MWPRNICTYVVLYYFYFYVYTVSQKVKDLKQGGACLKAEANLDNIRNQCTMQKSWSLEFFRNLKVTYKVNIYVV